MLKATSRQEGNRALGHEHQAMRIYTADKLKTNSHFVYAPRDCVVSRLGVAEVLLQWCYMLGDQIKVRRRLQTKKKVIKGRVNIILFCKPRACQRI